METTGAGASLLTGLGNFLRENVLEKREKRDDARQPSSQPTSHLARSQSELIDRIFFSYSTFY